MDDMTARAGDPAAGSPSPGPSVVWEPAPAAGSSAMMVPGAPGIEYSGTVPRLAAWLVDSVITVIIVFAVALIGGVVGVALGAGKATTTLVVSILAIAIHAAYFVLSWRSSSRATLGMRAMKLQIGRASDGSTVTVGQAAGRWFALSGLSTVGTLLALPSTIVNGLSALWALALLISVAVGARHQGIHDRLIGTAIARPAGASQTAAWVIVIGAMAIPFVAIIALIYLGSQISGILSTVGTPG